MPRKRQTQSGDPAQKIKSTPGQRYGEGKDQQQLMAAMPMPDVAGAPIASSAPPGVPVTPPQPVDPQQIGDFLGSNKPNLLGGSQMPSTPVTDGLMSGPGRGPEALMIDRTPISRYFRQLSEDTGNPKWKRLAERAGL